MAPTQILKNDMQIDSSRLAEYKFAKIFARKRVCRELYRVKVVKSQL